ncbi:asparagine synthetase [glutamine-hydrolyzing]-like isoform X2 [Arctopsyche grandis]|uniref:asparagine synthetase [glutamine-hydrolyzing]-like isoform X2 n=1 Tax=Arctopsyche grandis TaxID=121162 RepID=UPI00406D7C84
MCGIWALFGMDCPDCYIADFKRIEHRGPDASRLDTDKRLQNGCLGFHRLAIVDDLHGMQPMKIHQHPKITVVCNGEIYNYKTLGQQFGFKYETKCDVECILHLYVKFGFEKAIQFLDGDYAVCLVDMEKKKIMIARDPYGIRPLFRFYSDVDKIMGICSEAKGIINIAKRVNVAEKLDQFKPGTYEEYSFSDDGSIEFIKKSEYFSTREDVKFWKMVPHSQDFKSPADGIVSLLTEACRKRLMSDRRIGCLLSGGLDSSLVAALIVKLAKEESIAYPIQTFSIGMIGSPDLVAAKKVAKHIGSEHHEILLTEDNIALALTRVIYHLESFDITTVRAGVGMFLLCEYIKDNTNTAVIFSGEGADELAQGYIYFRDAPDTDAAHAESERLLSDIYLYDGLRADRMTAAFGLEVRCPFLDIDFTRYYLSLDKDSRRPKGDVEKYLLRNAFEGQNLLPASILWRPKEAFSDGVANNERSLFKVIQDLTERRVSDEEFNSCAPKFTHCKPLSKESYFYRKCFERYYSTFEHLIPYFWMPKWNDDVTDPSARYIKHYKSH